MSAGVSFWCVCKEYPHVIGFDLTALVLLRSGQNTGKEVFDCKINEFPPLEINYYKQRHIELEKKFIRSVLKSEINGSVKVRDQYISL